MAKKSATRRLRKKLWDAMSLYCRLRDAIEYCREMKIDIRQFNGHENIPAQCCSCGTMKSSWKRGDAGHFIPRGSGGSSGVYYDERNVHFQCKSCNAFKQGNYKGYEEFMLHKYGQNVIDLLWFKHRNHIYTFQELTGLLIFYTEGFEALEEESTGKS